VLTSTFGRGLQERRLNGTIVQVPSTSRRAERLLSMLRELNRRDLELPKNGRGLSRRLKSGKFRSLTVLHRENGPRDLGLTAQTGNPSAGDLHRR